MADSKISDLTALTSPASADQFVLVDADAGVTKKITFANLNSAISGAVAADDISVGDAAVNIATSAGSITIDAQAGDTDIIFKGTDNTSDITALTLDMSEAGAAIFNSTVTATGFIIGSASINETELEILDGATVTTDELNILDGVTATTAELNILDGVTASAADINLIDGITNGTVIASKAIITDANKDITGGRNITISGELDAGSLDISGNVDIDGTLETDALSINGTTVTSTAAELNILDGVTATAAEINALDGITSTVAELNILDGATLSTTELNYVDGVTSAIQTQLNTKSHINYNLTKTGTYTAVAGDKILCDTSGGAFTITLPASPSAGDEVHVLDATASFDSNNLTIGRNSKKIQGADADLTITTQNTGIGLVFYNDTYGWRVLVDAYDVDVTEL